MEKARRCPLEVLFRSILYNAVANVCNVRICDGQKGRELDPKTLPGCTLLEGKLESQSSADHPCAAPNKTYDTYLCCADHRTFRLPIPNMMPKRQGSCTYPCKSPVRNHLTREPTLQSHAVRCSWGKKPI